MATIARHNLTAHVTSTDPERRIALTGILIEGNKAVSTDGFCLLVTTIPDPTGLTTAAGPSEPAAAPIPPIVIPAKEASRFGKTKPGKHLPQGIVTTIENDGHPASHVRLEAVDIAGETIAARIPTIDAKYPNWQQSIPSDRPDDRVVRLSLEVLTKLVKAMRAAGAEDATFRFPAKANHAIRLDAKDQDEHPIVAVLMPMDMSRR